LKFDEVNFIEMYNKYTVNLLYIQNDKKEKHREEKKSSRKKALK